MEHRWFSKSKEIVKARKERKDIYRERAEKEKMQQNSKKELQNNGQVQQGDTKISGIEVGIEVVRSLWRDQETVLKEGTKKKEAVETFNKTYQTLEFVAPLLTSFKENLDVLLMAQEQTAYSLEELNKTMNKDRSKSLDKVKKLEFLYDINAEQQITENKVIYKQQKVNDFLNNQLETLKDMMKQLLTASHGNNSREKANKMKEYISRIEKPRKDLVSINEKLDEKGYEGIGGMSLNDIQEMLVKRTSEALNDAISKRPEFIEGLVSRLGKASKSFHEALNQHGEDLGHMFPDEKNQEELKVSLKNANQHYEKIQEQIQKDMQEQINTQKPEELYNQIKDELKNLETLRALIEIEKANKIKNAISDLKTQIATPQCNLQDCQARLKEYKNDMEARKTTIRNIREEYNTNIKEMLNFVKNNTSVDPEDHWKAKTKSKSEDIIQIEDIEEVKSTEQAIENLEKEIQLRKEFQIRKKNLQERMEKARQFIKTYQKEPLQDFQFRAYSGGSYMKECWEESKRKAEVEGMQPLTHLEELSQQVDDLTAREYKLSFAHLGMATQAVALRYRNLNYFFERETSPDWVQDKNYYNKIKKMYDEHAQVLKRIGSIKKGKGSIVSIDEDLQSITKQIEYFYVNNGKTIFDEFIQKELFKAIEAIKEQQKHSETLKDIFAELKKNCQEKKDREGGKTVEEFWDTRQSSIETLFGMATNCYERLDCSMNERVNVIDQFGSELSCVDLFIAAQTLKTNYGELSTFLKEHQEVRSFTSQAIFNKIEQVDMQVAQAMQSVDLPMGPSIEGQNNIIRIGEDLQSVTKLKEYFSQKDIIDKIKQFEDKILKEQIKDSKVLKDKFMEKLDNYKKKKIMENIESTNTVKRFLHWWKKAGLELGNQLRENVQQYCKNDEVTIWGLSDWIKQLRDFNEKDFKELTLLVERMKKCALDSEEDETTLKLVSFDDLKIIRQGYIDHIEFSKDKLPEEFGRAVDNLRKFLPHNEALLEDIPEEDLRVLLVAQGMRVKDKSKTMKSRFTLEKFRPYADKTTITYKGNNQFLIGSEVQDNKYTYTLDIKKRGMTLGWTYFKGDLPFSELVWGYNYIMLPSILKGESTWESQIKLPKNLDDEEGEKLKEEGEELKEEENKLKEELEKLKKEMKGTNTSEDTAMLKQKLPPKFMTGTNIENKETLGKMKLFKKLLGTNVFISDRSDKTYEGYIAMLATHVSYRALFLTGQHFDQSEITEIRELKEGFIQVNIGDKKEYPSIEEKV